MVDPGVPYRVGGFGGPEGLVDHLRREGHDALVDATHPFAARMSQNAVIAAARAGLPLLRLEPPPWRPQAGDRWQQVADMPAAAAALGSAPRRVFLSIGRLEVGAFAAAPQHDYLIRAIDGFEPGLARARVLAARGPFDLGAELALLASERIDVLISKNAGTPSTQAKLEAARRLRLPVVMVARPELPPAASCADVDGALGWLAALHGAPRIDRGV